MCLVGFGFFFRGGAPLACPEILCAPPCEIAGWRPMRNREGKPALPSWHKPPGSVLEGSMPQPLAHSIAWRLGRAASNFCFNFSDQAGVERRTSQTRHPTKPVGMGKTKQKFHPPIPTSKKSTTVVATQRPRIPHHIPIRDGTVAACRGLLLPRCLHGSRSRLGSVSGCTCSQQSANKAYQARRANTSA